MLGVPTFIHNVSIVITKTPNGGYAVSESKSDPVENCPSFETWAALVYYLENNYVPSV